MMKISYVLLSCLRATINQVREDTDNNIRQYAIAALVVVCAILLSSCASPGNLEAKPYHHIEDGFRNLPGGLPREDSSAFDRFFSFFLKKVIQDYGDVDFPEEHVVPYDMAVKQLRSVSPDSDTITWIGHMTTLIRLDGKVILTDPFFSDFATPVPPFGPERSIPPGIKVEDLPPIDIIIISHSHYDHLDLPSLKRIPNKDNITVIVPLKMGRYAKESGYKNVIELDWYDEADVESLKVIALPVYHWSQRGPFDRDEVLWSGFSIASSGKKIFFSGDWEYGTHYQILGRKYGPFDLGILAIGAYEPSFMMKGSHCKPINCLRGALDMKAKKFMPAGWGTIWLGLQPFAGPVDDFKQAAKELNISQQDMMILSIGETRIIESTTP